MFRRKKSKADDESTLDPNQDTKNSHLGKKLEYPKPKILLMDIDSTVADHLSRQGFNINTGSFGRPYKVSSNMYHIRDNSDIPKHIEEQQIVIVDLDFDDFLQEPVGKPIVLNDGTAFITELHHGIADPRPIIMQRYQRIFNQIYEYGGIFIIFAGMKHNVAFKSMGSLENVRYFGDFDEINTWSFLSQLSRWHMEIRVAQGQEIELVNGDGILSQLLRTYIKDSEYICTLDYTENSDNWLPIANNKFNKTVAGILASSEKKSGSIFIFPRIRKQAEFLTDFILEYLPSIRPKLFPYFEGLQWIHSDEYEMSNVSVLVKKIDQVRQDADSQIAELNIQVTSQREANKYIYDLLTETGDNLVSAVKTTLETIEFPTVVDMDEELRESEKNEPKREDLQISENGKELILVEVKGISNTPRDSSALQVSKYIAPRMKSLKRTDIRGLAIINHQRNIPALDREQNPFNEDILDSAEQSEFGLFTTWNLHKLVRNFIKFGWDHRYIRDLFYKNGFINPIPLHYEYVGVIEEYWKKSNVIGIRIEQAELLQGDTIAYDFEIEFEQQNVTSLQVNKAIVKVASIGQLAGVLIEIDSTKIKKNIKIYRISKTSTD